MEHQRTGRLAAQDADDDRIIWNDAGQHHEALAGMLDGGVDHGITVVGDTDFAIAIDDTEPDSIGSNALYLTRRSFEASSLLRCRPRSGHRAKHGLSRRHGLAGLPALGDDQSLLFPSLRFFVVGLRRNRDRLICEISREEVSRREEPADENNGTSDHGQARLATAMEEGSEMLEASSQPCGRTGLGRNNDARQHRFGLLRLLIIDRAEVRIGECFVCLLDQPEVRRCEFCVADCDVGVVALGEGNVGCTNDGRVGRSGHTQNQIVVNIDSHLARASAHG